MLHLRDVAKRYGAVPVIRNVTCTIHPGTVHLLLGDNGAGKTTLLRLMARLASPTAGTVEYDPPSRQCAFLGHAGFLYPGLTALENLRFWRDAQRLPKSDAHLLELLDRVGLAAHAHRRAAVFSRGMAQRLSLARVLLQQADILLLDEPGTGLDAASRTLLHDEVKQARDRGAAVVLITHDVAQDVRLADRVLLLRNRTLAYDGDVGGFQEAAA
ncbi:MAG: heme ABC exporter ATP-binding protein CcmA [Desulfovibrio sp.]|jgi:heme exporter protein A|nr:heme ABC exporter ATP-binding protein CcmA [Desulfovibrio sp.]